MANAALAAEAPKLANHLSFDSEAHEYRWNGRIVPSVTQLLKPLQSFDMVPKHLLDAAAEFGTNVHRAVELMINGNLNWATLDPALEPYVKAADKWLNDTNAVVLGVEERFFNTDKRYAGTIDLVCRIPAKNDQVHIIDWKSAASVPRTVGPQTAAYAKGYKSKHDRTPARSCVTLKGDGNYNNHPQTNRSDWTMFQTCLNLYNWVNQ